MADAFDSEDANLMARALDHAWKQLEATGLLHGDSEESAKAVLTRAILEAATHGERDEYKLAAYALSHYQQTSR
jgi:hypothetical protein